MTGQSGIDAPCGLKRLVPRHFMTFHLNLCAECACCVPQIFRDARDKGDGTSKKMYKQLVSMHEAFASLSACLEKQGTLQNESRELERRIEQVLPCIAYLAPGTLTRVFARSCT